MRWQRAGILAILLAPIVLGAGTRHTAGNPPMTPEQMVRDTTGCLDTLHATDSVSAVVKMSVRPQDPKVRLSSNFEGLFVQEFRSRLRAPAILPLSVMSGWTPCDTVAGRCTGGVLSFGSHAYAFAHPAGTLSRIVVVDYTLTPAFSDSVRAVLERISKEKMSPPINGKDSVLLDLSIEIEQHADTVPAFRHVFRVSIPHYNMPFTFANWPKDTKPPKYPSIAQARGVGDSVALTFTIQPDGTIAPQSVDVRAGHYADFIRAVYDRLAITNYQPARIGSCPVATNAGQSFVFKMP